MMDPLPYRYQFTNVDRSYDYDLSRMDWYPTFGIFVQEQPIGILSLKRIDHSKHSCEIGLMLQNDSCKNQGYGTKALQLAMTLAVEKYGIQSIWADTMGCNTRMQHVLEKLGFTLVERIPQIYRLPDRREDRLNYVWHAASGATKNQ